MSVSGPRREREVRKEKKNVILTLSDQPAQCTVKIAATAEGERREREGGMA